MGAGWGAAGLALGGFGALALAGYAAISQHRASQISGAPYAAPVEVYGLLLVGAVLGVLGGIQLSGEFRPITSYMSDRVHDSETYRPAFVNLNHRGAMRSGR